METCEIIDKIGNNFDGENLKIIEKKVNFLLHKKNISPEKILMCTENMRTKIGRKILETCFSEKNEIEIRDIIYFVLRDSEMPPTEILRFAEKMPTEILEIIADICSIFE